MSQSPLKSLHIVASKFVLHDLYCFIRYMGRRLSLDLLGSMCACDSAFLPSVEQREAELPPYWLGRVAHDP